MAKVNVSDKASLLSRLETITYEPEDDSESQMLEEMSMAASLLKLANIDQEKEYQICRSVADHLLKTVPEPEDLDIDLE